jgi:hypothetical protein
LFIRTYERGERIYQAMLARENQGFSPIEHIANKKKGYFSFDDRCNLDNYRTSNLYAIDTQMKESKICLIQVWQKVTVYAEW